MSAGAKGFEQENSRKGKKRQTLEVEGKRMARSSIAFVGFVLTVVGAIAPVALADDPAIPCSWSLEDTPRHGPNYGWTDMNTGGWVTTYRSLPGSRLVIHGQYPRARFFVIDVYDAKGNPYVPNLLDASLAPDRGGTNPFAKPRRKAGSTYTAFVEFTARPPRPVPNTVYAGTGIDGAPNPGGVIALRIYLPDDPSSPTGGVPLPDVFLELASGQRIRYQACEGPRKFPGQSAVREAMTETAYPDSAPTVVPFPLAQNPPVWKATRNPNADTTIGGTLPVSLPARTGVGLLTTPDNAYLDTRITRQFGEIFVFRARAPRSPDTRSGEWAGRPSDVRYWSICINSTLGASQTIDCLADHEIRRDRRDYFTVVISDPAHRPRNARNWLPLGDVYDGWIYIRQFLASSRFAEAIARVPSGVDPSKTMKSYFPSGGYCSETSFEQNELRCLR